MQCKVTDSLHMMLQKFYVKERSVDVIVETSLGSTIIQAEIYKFITDVYNHRFISLQIFNRHLESEDYFGLLTMSGGSYKNTDM